MLPVCRTAGDLYANPQCDVESSVVEGFLDELCHFHAAFRHCFMRSEPPDHFFRYMVGQFSSLACKSIEPIALQTEATSVRAMQRGISTVQWDEQCMLQTYRRLVADEMGEPDKVRIVDETGFPEIGSPLTERWHLHLTANQLFWC
jgi:hypothetical protein